MFIICTDQISSLRGFEPCKASLCSSRCSYVYEHTGSIKWTQEVTIKPQQKSTWSLEVMGGEKLGQFDLNICIFEMVSFKRVFIFSYFLVSTWLGTHLKVRWQLLGISSLLPETLWVPGTELRVLVFSTGVYPLSYFPGPVTESWSENTKCIFVKIIFKFEMQEFLKYLN